MLVYWHNKNVFLSVSQKNMLKNTTLYISYTIHFPRVF